jgi:hypothetical protein
MIRCVTGGSGVVPSGLGVASGGPGVVSGRSGVVLGGAGGFGVVLGGQDDELDDQTTSESLMVHWSSAVQDKEVSRPNGCRKCSNP